MGHFLQQSQIALIFSIFFKATLFVDREGEIRLNPGCSAIVANRFNSSENMMKMCEGVGSARRCVYASSTGHHFLAMDRATGRLRTVTTPQEKPSQTENTSTCIWFVENSKVSNTAKSVTVIGCPMTRRYPLSFAGASIRGNMKCESVPLVRFRITQQAKTQRRIRMNLFYTDQPITEYLQRRCVSVSKARKLSRCTGGIRDSYPVHRNPCR